MLPLLALAAVFASSTSLVVATLQLSTNLLYSPVNNQKIVNLASNTIALNAGWFPKYTTHTGKWVWFPPIPDGWTAYYLSSMLFAMNERQQLCPGLADGVDWVGLGRNWSAPLLKQLEHNTVQSAVGSFSVPFQADLALNPSNGTAANAVIGFANELASRFDFKIGCVRSWDPPSKPTNFSVIIEDMMNIQVFMAAYELNRNETLRDHAVSHADQTMKKHIRSDGSSYHVISFNQTTGAVIGRAYSSHYTWARGQAYGILGFARMYNSTKYERYLDTARKMATYFIHNIPTSQIVPWNLQSNATNNPVDSSAAMIGVQALLTLQGVETDPNRAQTLKDAAWKILYANGPMAWKPEWDSILANGTDNNAAHPANNGTGTIYGDYYWIQIGNTLLRNKMMACN